MKRKRKTQYMYGKFYHETYEFRRGIHDLFAEFLSHHSFDMKSHNEIIDLRNKVVALLHSWIGSHLLEQKLGVQISLSSDPTSIEAYIEKQAMSYSDQYRPCEICGEERITHYCHIVPRSYGGAESEDNYIYLCPTHHHLFDKGRLSREEWDKLDLTEKMPAAQDYANKVRLTELRNFWQRK